MWSDYVCPYAFKGHRRLAGVLAARPGLEVAWVPFELHGERSRPALMAAEYARDAGAFDAMHDRLFTAAFDEGAHLGRPDVLAGLAEEVGLPASEVVAAVAEHRYLDRIVEGMEAGFAHGVTGTPSYLLEDGTVLRGLQTEATLMEVL